MKIKKNDQVQILSGKDRGKRGKVLKVDPKLGKLIVEGLNLAKRHRRPKKGGEKGQIVEVPALVSVSKVMLICTVCGKPAKVGYKITEGGKSRICKKCKAEIK
jgi:large subunit ribosomal protein L24